MAVALMTYGPKTTFYQQTSDRQINDLQQSLAESTRNFQILTPLSGTYITSITDSSGVPGPILLPQNVEVPIVHNLGYAYTGWLIASINYVSGALVAPFIVDAASVSINPDPIEAHASRLVLVNLAPVTVAVHVWVY